MYLKRMELHGFKSFADRVQIEFQPGINAIVGPNGSGKSNIIDAIRWVLGEQSVRTLRGYKLEDVIFSGSNKKRPMGMAEVSITLDNTNQLIPLDYSEICFIRRAFRSGESEFYLNRTPCRLKDIQELLIDTGIGKDGYSIISQGQIDEILICRPEERRAIFEETAGIMKHKVRKKEAEKRLDDTMDNISRIDDVLNELSNRLIPLKVQKDVALKYKKLMSSFEEKDINLILVEVENGEKKLNNIKNNLSKYKNLLVQLDTSKESYRKQITEYKSKLNINEDEYQKIQKDLFTVSSERKNFEKDLQWAINGKTQINSENNDVVEQIKQKKSEEQKLKHSLNLKVEDLKQKIKVINQLEITVAENEKKFLLLDNMINENERLIDNLKGDVIALLNYVSEKRNIISSLNTMKLNLENRLKQIQTDLLQLDDANTKTLEEVKGIQVELERLECLCLDLETEKEKLKNTFEQRVVELDSNKEVEVQKQQNLTTLISRMKALKEINDSYDGYQFGVKNLLTALNNQTYKDSGIYGPVADVINVDKQYEVAIETALGGALQNIICETEENAKKAIEYLKKQGHGRVTFLPLSTVKPRSLNTHEATILSEKGCISTAIDLVTFDKKYFSALAYLLGRVIVAANLDDAIAMAKWSRFAFKVVTIQGEILYPGGSITGGSQKRSNLLLGRKRQLVEYDSDIKRLRTQLDKIKQDNQVLADEIQNKQKTIEEKIERIYSVKSEIAVLKKQLQEKQNLLEERWQRKAQIKKEKASIKAEMSDILAEISSVKNDIGTIDGQNISSQSKAKELQGQMTKDKKTREQMSNEVTELRIKLASYKQEEIALKQSIQEIERNLKIKSKEIQDLQVKLEGKYKKVISLETNINKYKDDIQILTNKEQKLYVLMESLKKQKALIKNSIERFQERLNAVETEYEQLRNKLHDCSIEEATVNIELNQIKNKLYERYSLTIPEALKLRKEVGTIDELNKDLQNLKKEIESLGPVNMQAIADYGNLKTRYDFLKTQRDDLMKAKCKLDVLIDKITKTMEEMLLESIETINKEFEKVFFELFEGGKAELIIDCEESVLECGVDINAQPPGKKLQNLSLLSGGERALTAIALLFAILNTKATPFCVLDEIEATLDDANIDRFTRYLKKVSKHTQFIIITHRKSTMEVADALYGTSMEETAVSKILTVKMEKKEVS